MNRIVYMVLRNLYRAPYWFFVIYRFCRENDHHTLEERYAFLSRMVKKINCSGRVEVVGRGVDKLPKKDGYILFPNHQGLFDSLALFATYPRPFGIVIKQEAAKWILVKQVIQAIKGISIDREDLKASVEVIHQVTEEVKNGRNFVIFPEGTRSREGNQILPFKSGTFKSAVNAKCPIVPVALIDSFKPFDLPSIKRVKVQVHYLDPIYPEEYAGMKTKEIASLVHDRIQREINLWQDQE